MIARIWRGRTRAEDVAAYLEVLRATGVAALRGTEGNRGVAVLQRNQGDVAEFLILSLWDSREAVTRFAGPDPERAVYYEEDESFLLEKEPHVRHYEVLDGP